MRDVPYRASQVRAPFRLPPPSPAGGGRIHIDRSMAAWGNDSHRSGSRSIAIERDMTSFPSPAQRGKVPAGRKGADVREGAKQQFARQLRSSLTEAEKRLWYRLRRRQLENWRFRRQVPIGPYVVDFVCTDARLVVEVDGSQHLDFAPDITRDARLDAEGYRVLRFWNHDVVDRTESVLTQILEALNSTRPLPPSGHLSLQAGEGKSGRAHVPDRPLPPFGHLPRQAGEGNRRESEG